MSAHCGHDHPAPVAQGPYRKILWIALVVNAAMFFIEITAGVRAGSVSLLADSVDFFGDAANYGISLWVLAMSVAARARASLLKAASMAAFGVAVLGSAIWQMSTGVVPVAATMGVIGTLALLANVGVAMLLYAYRNGDSNMRSVWLCTRNDALGNVAVLLAAVGVFGTGQAWPDFLVAVMMAGLALWSAAQVLRLARAELAQAARSEAA